MGAQTMIGTLINVAAIIVGGGAGLIIKHRLGESMQDSLLKALGLATLFIGASGALTGLLAVTDQGLLTTKGAMIMIISLVVGTIIGELLKIEYHLNQLGEKLKLLLKAENNSSFATGFVTNTLVVCVGAMAVVGSIEEGMTGNFSTLFAKAMLDCIITLIFASTLGIGVLFSAIPLLIYQGSITLLAQVVSPFFSETLINNLSFVGSVLIFAIGLNLILNSKIKVGNMIPALLVPIVIEVVQAALS